MLTAESCGYGSVRSGRLDEREIKVNITAMVPLDVLQALGGVNSSR
ncbi:MAG: hypothetical protein ACYC2T_07865 [Bacillota bacterium]